jgi:Cu-processing system ATP-binding protein
MTTIEVEDVTKTYGDVTALDSVSLAVEAGRTVGLVGTNGAGKTTLFKLLLGLDRPDAGELRVAGVSPAEGAAVRRRVGYLPEQAGFPGSLTGREVLRFHARVRDVPGGERDRRVAETLDTVGLSTAADRRVGGYSNGMTRRLGLATAVVGRPDVLLLDEPTAGLDPQGVDAFHGVVERVADERDVTVVFSTHALAEVERLCERAVVVHGGRVRAAGTLDDLRTAADDRVTVRARPVDRAAALSVARDREAVEVVDDGDGDLVLRCPRGAAFDLVAALRDATALDGFEVREPGLEAAFREHVAGEGSDESEGGEPA